uniref:30S ribosomal protein S5 n=1 Tax=Arundo donax TaxID=35708 RepID=A0A0A9GHK4_ARUDO
MSVHIALKVSDETESIYCNLHMHLLSILYIDYRKKFG